MIRFTKNRNEMCYPFMHERSYLCDFEVITDELCTQMGLALSALEESCNDIRDDLALLQPLAFHLNGSVRGRLAITEADLQRVETRYCAYREIVGDLPLFILPRGTDAVVNLHLCRSLSKKAIRALVRVDEEGIDVPDVLPRLCHLFCNLFFIMTVVINRRRGVDEIPFESRSYGPK